jgi:hypothetical protein
MRTAVPATDPIFSDQPIITSPPSAQAFSIHGFACRGCIKVVILPHICESAPPP